MTITESNDNDLRRLIFEKEKVVVKFVADDCPVCKLLAPAFARFSADPVFQGITFVRMNASENPVSSQKITGAPFFATYRKGTLTDCGIVSTEDDLHALLMKLK